MLVGYITRAMAISEVAESDFIEIGWAFVGYSWVYIAIWFFICMGTKHAIYKLLKS